MAAREDFGGRILQKKNLPWVPYLSPLGSISCPTVSAKRGAGSCDAESGLVSESGGAHIHLPRNLCARAYTMPHLSSVVPAPRFAATMGHYLIKIWNPREIFLGNHPAKILHWAPRENLSLGIRNAPPN